MATAPTFTSASRLASADVATANVGRDGTGTIVTLITGVAAGTRVFEVVAEAIVTTTAGMIRLFLHDGTTARLFDEIPVAAVTVSASVAGARTSRTYTNLILPTASWSLRASTHNAEAHVLSVMAGDLT